jgi:hypothetical protein
MSERLRQIYLPSNSAAGATRKECRARAAELDAIDRAQRRAAAQRMSSPALNVAERIQLWETMHRLRLPTTSNHSLIPIIATRTGLTVEAVVAEQRRRMRAQGMRVMAPEDPHQKTRQ